MSVDPIKAGIPSVENWNTFIVGFLVILDSVPGALTILPRIMRSRSI